MRIDERISKYVNEEKDQSVVNALTKFDDFIGYFKYFPSKWLKDENKKKEAYDIELELRKLYKRLEKLK